MEKFTIDLDQVLNDFEYKELTDQYISKNVPETRTSTVNHTEKHTINNVFHSLNEYLNTSIKINSLESTDNKLGDEIDHNKAQAPSCSAEPSQSHTKLNIRRNSDVSQESHNCDLNKNVQDSIIESEKVDTEIVETETENEIVIQEPQLCDTTDHNFPDIEDKQVFIEEPHGIKVKTENLICCLDPNTSEIKEICSESTTFESENNSSEKPSPFTNELKPDKVFIIENQALKDETLTNISQEELEAQIAEEKSEVKIIEAELMAEIGNNILGDTSSKVVQNVPSKIGFDPDLDLDDKEISKLLDELETDDDLKEFQYQVNPTTQAENLENSAIKQNVEEQTNLTEVLQNKNEVKAAYLMDSITSNLNCDMAGPSSETLDNSEARNYLKDDTSSDVISKHTENDSNNVECSKDTGFNNVITVSKEYTEQTIVADKITVSNETGESRSAEHSKNTEDWSLEMSVPECDKDEKPSRQEHVEIPERKEDICCETDTSGFIKTSLSDENILEGSHSDLKGTNNQLSSEIVDDKIITASSDVIPTKTNKIRKEVVLENVDTVIKKKDKDSTLENPEIDTSGRRLPKDTFSNQESCSVEKENSQDSLTRPHDLPLKEAENTRKSIDLIGGPGSTPYNNVYIDKEIEQTRHDSDTDSSTSSSPSFSDTNSASTASTEEIQDEDVPITKNLFDNPSKPEHNPTTVSVEENCTNNSVENEGLKSADAPTSSQSTSLAGGDAVSGVSSQEDDKPSPSIIPPDKYWLGKEAPLWVPDSDALACLHCDMKFTVLKRRHHCRACGLVLCSKCCHLRFRLEYLDGEGRVCNKCHDILNMRNETSGGGEAAATPGSPAGGSSSSGGSPESSGGDARRPNPNNPLEYCSTVSPLQQAAAGGPGGSGQQAPPPAIMVPIGVLKRKGSNKGKSNKSVMFCDGIRPGSDLTNLDNDFNYNNTITKKLEKNSTSACAGKINRHLPIIDSQTNTFIPSSENNLPPTVTFCKTEITYTECSNSPALIETLKKDQLTFAIHINLYVHLKLINMNCCINKWAWCFSTEGLINVGQDEVVYLIEYVNGEMIVPKDVFHHISGLYSDAVKGNSVSELGVSLHNSPNFLDSKNHAGFVYIRPSFQCMENVIKPKDPYVIGILIHRWETPWAKLFPLRLILRLGAEYRYYPSPIISTRNRDSVFVEIGHTIINLLADFRNFSYSLPQIRGLTIHMEEKNTTVTIPVNRYDLVVKSLNNSSDHILAFAGNFSSQADSHLVCIQDTQGNEDCYSTHAINIQNKPRKITGASFIVFNGALKSTSGLTAKSNIVEDGLMIQVLPEHMQQIREHLRAMKNHTISCGPVNSPSDETVNIIWGDNDINFNVGILSAIDGLSLSGIPSMRVHNGKNHVSLNGNRIIRWTEVFVIQSGQENPKNQDPVDVSRVSETIAKACCDALVKYLDLLLANSFQKVAVRATLQPDDVSYVAGSNGTKLPPIYMKSLDNELVPVLHRITSSNLGDSPIVLELIFRILNV